MDKNFYSLGLMSGTSMDGIDASIIKSDGEQFIEIIDDLYLKYNDQLKLKLKQAVDLCTSKDKFNLLSKSINEIEKEITLSHIEACNLIIGRNNNINVNLIGFHGQTILHKPDEGYSIQIGDSKLLLKNTKKTVVSNFRTNDILNGGQGAPLAPIYHHLLLKKNNLNLPSAIINIGGISNITYVGKDNKILSYDTGPGNILIDKWVSSKTKKDYDEDGLIAKSGKINEDKLKKLLNKPYYKKKIPKSLDIKDFDIKDLNNMSIEDGSATLSMLTVESICKAVNSLDKNIDTILFCGGGRKNNFIMSNIKKKIKAKVSLIDEFGVNGDFVESQTFAYLAIRSYLKKFITFPNTSGVKKPCLGGVLFKN